VLRKVYLYAAVFVAVLTVVTTVTFVLASLFRRAFHVISLGTGSDIAWPSRSWCDGCRVGVSRLDPTPRCSDGWESQGQIWVRQLYRYLVAASGWPPSWSAWVA